MIKKIMRSPVLKVFAFAVGVACVFLGVYHTTYRLYWYCAENDETGFIYDFERSFENSRFLRDQLNTTASNVDWAIYYEFDSLLQADGKTINPTRLNELTSSEWFIGNISFKHNGIEYNGGASRSDPYYIEITPGNLYADGIYADIHTFMYDSWIPITDESDTDYYEDDDGSYYEDEVPDEAPEEPQESYSSTDYILVSVSEEQAEQYESRWHDERRNIVKAIRQLIYYAIIGIMALIYLLCVAGRSTVDDEMHMMLIDNMPVEANLIMFSLLCAGAGVAAFLSIEIALEQELTEGLMEPLAAGTALCVGLAVALLMSLMRNIKNHTLLSHSLCWRAVRWCWNTIKKVCKRVAGICKGIAGKRTERTEKNVNKSSDGVKRWFKRSAEKLKNMRKNAVDTFVKNFKTRNVALIFLGYTALLGFFAAWFGLTMAFSEDGVPLILGIVWFCVACSFVLKRVKGFDIIVDGIKRLRAGELEYKLTGLPEGIFSSMAEDINSLGEGMRAAIKTEVRAERMKSELITNVSHDLKTPLTSIINYSELLCQEHLTPEEANDYAKIIYQKSLRLKNLTSDLFDISKVQSGVENMDCERLDVCTLVRQALAEQEKSIQASGLTVRTSIPDHEVPIWADGKKMSRVMENLLGNCVKYAMRGTRVYLTVAENEGAEALIELKNIANYEMNFDADEITERFVRGDESRSTEGSGLGLAIAKSYVNACGGMLKAEADGDLFKVRIIFPLFEDYKKA